MSISEYTDTDRRRKVYTETNPGPYEIVMDKGAEALTDAQLLAAVLRTGTSGMNATELSGKILDSCRVKKGLPGLFGLTIQELKDIKGIGTVKAVQICCVRELGRRIAKCSFKERLDFSRADTVADYYMRDLMHLDNEHVLAAFLDSKCGLIEDKVLSVGGVNSSVLLPRDVLSEALRYRAVSFVLLHNHPSGDPTPSTADILLTDKIRRAAEVIGIQLLDHIIIGNNIYKSFKEEKLL